MQQDHDLAVGRRYFTEVWNPRNLAALDDLFPPTCTLVLPGGEEQEVPVSGFADSIECWHKGFDGLRYNIDHEAVTEDGTVLFSPTTFSGTHTGQFQWLDYTAPGNRPDNGSPAGSHSPSMSPTDGSHGCAGLWNPQHLAQQLGITG